MNKSPDLRLRLPRPRFSSAAKIVALLVCVALGATSTPAQRDGLSDPLSYGRAIDVRLDLAFGEEEHQKLDLFVPAGAGLAPVVICWFGGAFWGGDKTHMERVAAYFAAHGLAAAAPGYFLGTKDGSRAAWPRAIHDAKAAVRFVRANATDLKVDASRIVALGYSSGAYLATMVGLTPNLPELEGSGAALSVSSRVYAVIAIAGVYDRRRTLGLPLGLLGQGYEEKHDLRVAASPIVYVGPKTVPVYLLHGTRDSVADVSSATQLAAALADARVSHELRLVDADHYPITASELHSMIAWLAKILPTRPQ